MKINFGVHLGFAITRYPDPNDWMEFVKKDLKIKNVQFVSDLLDPSLPIKIQNYQINKINDLKKKYNIKINSTFTSPRYNFIGHPDYYISNYWYNWIKKFLRISKKIEAKSSGSLLGIFSVNNFKNKKSQTEKKIIEGWKKLSIYAESIGLEYLTWEPMSIKREMGETIDEAIRINDLLNDKNNGVPIKFCLDVDHGDLSSKNKNDYDPYSWIKKIGNESPVIHLKQKTSNVYGHKPFTKINNKDGIIKPNKIIKLLKNTSIKEVNLYLELSFREREPYESQVTEDLQESIAHWKKYL